MNFVESKAIVDIFKLLNENQVEYILMRNIDNKIPYKLKLLSDIDILVDKKTFNKIENLLIQNGYQENKRHCIDDIYLYGIDKYRQFIKKDILLDFQFQLMARSLDAGQWIPLDETIQISAWKNRRFEQQSEDFGYWTLSYDDEFICLVARSIFDKKEFQDGYIKRINELQPLLSKEEVVKKLNMVFFKFAPYLLEMIEKQEFDKIITNYLQFKEY